MFVHVRAALVNEQTFFLSRFVRSFKIISDVIFWGEKCFNRSETFPEHCSNVNFQYLRENRECVLHELGHVSFVQKNLHNLQIWVLQHVHSGL